MGDALTDFGLMNYGLVKWLHIVSSTLLFGTSLGTAFYMVCANSTRDVHAIAVVARHVVLADWLFTATSVVLQPITGFYLVGPATLRRWGRARRGILANTGGAIDSIEHEAMQVEVKIGGGSGALDQGDGADVGFSAFESGLLDQKCQNDTVDDLQDRREQLGCDVKRTESAAGSETRLPTAAPAPRG